MVKKMTMEEIKDGYFNYLVNVMLEALYNADGYDCKDFNMIKLELIVNLNKIFSSRENYNQVIEVLKEDEQKKKGR